MRARYIMVRCVAIAGVCLLAACSTEGVRCERHLTPINMLQAAPDHGAPAHDGTDPAAKGGVVSDAQKVGAADPRPIAVRAGSAALKDHRQTLSAGRGKRP